MDPYERKEDLARDEYARLNSKILFQNQPFSHVVRQHGTFYPNMMTFGTTREFKEKKASPAKAPLFGAFKAGDPAHVGHNKTFGGNGRSTEYTYVEECEQDKVQFQKNVTKPRWNTTAQMSKSMMNATVSHNPRNVNRDNSLIFSS